MKHSAVKRGTCDVRRPPLSADAPDHNRYEKLLAMPCPPHAYKYEGLRAVDGVDMWVWRCVKCQHEDVEDIGPF